MNSQHSKEVDEYIANFPEGTQMLLQQLRSIIRSTAPDSEEVISYAMPAYKWNGMLVYFAAYAKHIGFYPMSEAIVVFKDELVPYKTSKGAIQFPINQPLPMDLIQRIVQFRMDKNEQTAYSKKKTKN